MFTDGEWRTNIFTHSCSLYEMHGSSFHCEHHFGTKTVALGGGFTATHTNECACYCNNSADSTLTHHYSNSWDAQTDIIDANTDRRRHMNVGTPANPDGEQCFK
jgi:hypothetical protein